MVFGEESSSVTGRCAEGRLEGTWSAFKGGRFGVFMTIGKHDGRCEREHVHNVGHYA